MELKTIKNQITKGVNKIVGIGLRLFFNIWKSNFL